MKILHVISQTPDYTGSGKYLAEIIKQSRLRGHENYLVAGIQNDFILPKDILPMSMCRFIKFGVDLDFPIVGMSDVMPYESTVCSHLTQKQIEQYQSEFRNVIEKAVKDFSPDIIHTNHLWMATAVTCQSTPDIPIVTTCHGTCLRQHDLCPELGESLKIRLAKIDKVIALFDKQKQQISEKLNIKADKIEIISGGFNEKIFFYKERKLRPESVEILYAGKLNESKGVSWLLKSLSKIKNIPFHLHIAGGGSGPEKDLCLELSKKLGERVTIHGIISHERLSQLMRRAHIFVLPSFFEGLPLVLLESLACGCKIITTDLPGTMELFKDHSSGMVKLVKLPKLMTVDRPDPDDMPKLIKELQILLEESMNEVLTGNKPDIEFIKKTSEPYTWQNIFSKIEELYNETVISKHNLI